MERLKGAALVDYNAIRSITTKVCVCVRMCVCVCLWPLYDMTRKKNRKRKRKSMCRLHDGLKGCPVHVRLVLHTNPSFTLLSTFYPISQLSCTLLTCHPI